MLLHGHPRTHTTWHRVAPRLADALHGRLPRPARLRRVAADRPVQARDGGRDRRALMRALGHRRATPPSATTAASASRIGSRVDHGVTRLVVLDGVPIAEALERCDARFAASWWHWFFFAQTEKPAEDWIVRDPLAWYRGDPDGDGRREPRGLAARGHRPGGDPLDGRRLPRRRAGRSPSRGRRPRRGPPRDAARRCSPGPCTTTWRSSTATRWRSGAPGSTAPLRGARIDSGHHMAEEAPEQLADVLTEFLWTSASCS